MVGYGMLKLGGRYAHQLIPTLGFVKEKVAIIYNCSLFFKECQPLFSD